MPEPQFILWKFVFFSNSFVMLMLTIWVHDIQTLSPSFHGLAVCVKKILRDFQCQETQQSRRTHHCWPCPNGSKARSCSPPIWLLLLTLSWVPTHIGLGPVTLLGSWGKNKSKQLPVNGVLSSDSNPWTSHRCVCGQTGVIICTRAKEEPTRATKLLKHQSNCYVKISK